RRRTSSSCSPPSGCCSASPGRARGGSGWSRRPQFARRVSGPRIAIGAGGTAGHVVPALAVADALRADGAEVVFIGGERAERDLVPKSGYELRTLHVEPLARGKPLRAGRAAVTDAAAVRRAWELLAELSPGAVLGAGGYVSGPVGLAAVLRRLPLVLMEADSHLGLTN